MKNNHLTALCDARQVTHVEAFKSGRCIVNAKLTKPATVAALVSSVKRACHYTVATYGAQTVLTLSQA